MEQHILMVPGPGDDQSRKLAYTEFGDANNPKVLFCVHGVSRCGRDFDAIAEALSDVYRVICPDMAGRGGSDWLDDPAGYGMPVYLSDIKALRKHVGAERIDWIGTSMGGLIGMVLASMGDKSPIDRMVMNDIGPFIPKESLQRISTYLGTTETFADVAAIEAYIRDVNAAFGPLTDPQWAFLASHSHRPAPDGNGLRLHYDPRIVEPFKAGSDEDADMWGIWDKVSCPTLVLHGSESDLLSKETVEEMTKRGPEADYHTFVGNGHAPALLDDEQISVVRNWLVG